jgi:hypothetical protein
MTLDELLTKYPSYILSTQYCTPPTLASSRICFHNFYQQIFPDLQTPVHLLLLFFNEKGQQVATFEKYVETADSVQIEAADAGYWGPGLVAVVAVPDFDLVRYSEGRIKLKKTVGTGFYIVWHDKVGHVDTMHEWMPVERGCLPARTHYMVFDQAGGVITRHGIVLVNPIAHKYGMLQANITCYAPDRKTLGRTSLDPVPAMGSRLVFLNDLFAEFEGWLSKHQHVGVKVSGCNLVEPLTVELHRSGDFHIHHIN